MTECQLTPEGRELVEWWADLIRDGSSYLNAHYLEDNGEFAIMGKGDHRIVYKETTKAMTGMADTRMFESGQCVVKLALHPDPWQMRNEIINYEFAPDEARQYLADIHEYADDGVWLTMDRAVDRVEPSDQREVIDNLRDVVETSDLHGDNIGYIDGEPIIIDYGYGFRVDGERIGPKHDEFFEPTRHETKVAERWEQ